MDVAILDLYHRYRGAALHASIIAATTYWVGPVVGVTVAYALHTGFLFEIEFGDGTTLARRPSRILWRAVKTKDIDLRTNLD